MARSSAPADTGAPVPFGGISGLDYDPGRDRWIAISDDRSEHGPARAYFPRLRYGQGGLEFDPGSWVPLAGPDGRPFAPKSRGGEAADAEAVRFDPRGPFFLWATEGDPSHGFAPALRIADFGGRTRAHLPLPASFRFDRRARRGPYRNATLEGVAVAPGGRAIWICLEGPLREDGKRPTADRGALVRLSKLDRSGRVLAQFAYPLDPIPTPQEGRTADNGVSEILVLDDQRLLMLERSGVQAAEGRYAFHVRLYLVDTRSGEDVRHRPSLRSTTARPLVKRLLIDFDELEGRPVGNLEAMAWGPPLPDGAASLVLMSDNNFETTTPTEIVVLRLDVED